MTLKPDNTVFVNKEFDPVIFSTILIRTWYWIPLMIALFVFMGYIYLRYTKPVFRSNMIIQVTAKDQGADVLDLRNVNSRVAISREIELLKSEFILEKAIQSLELKVSHYAQGEFLAEELYHQSKFKVTPIELKDSSLCHKPIFIDIKPDKSLTLSVGSEENKKKFAGKVGEVIETELFSVIIKVDDLETLVKDLEKNKIFFEFNNINVLTAKMIKKLSVSPIDVEARTIEVAFESNNGYLSRDIANAVSNAFFRYDETLKKESADNILKFIDVQLDSLTQELRKSKDSIMLFQRRENLPDPENYAEALSSRIEKMENELFKIDEEIQTLNELERKIVSNPNRFEIYKMIPDILGYSFESSLYNQVKELHDQLERKEELMFNLTSENQTMKILDRRIESTIENINRTLEFLKRRLMEKKDFLKENIKNMRQNYFRLPEKKMELNRLRGLQQLNEKYYTLFTEKQVQYSISNAGYTSQSKVLKRPFVSKEPISPNINLIYGGTGILGLIVGFTILFFRYISFNEINLLSDLEKLVPQMVGVLGAIPYVQDNKMLYSQLIVHESPKSLVAESFRSIRTNMSYVKKDAKTIAISSSISGEGKTFVSLNLSGVIAMSGKSIVLLDLDLRKPKVHIGLNTDNEKGMSSLLVGQYKIEECIQHTEIKGFDFITAGPIPPNPSELLLKDSFNDIIDKLKEMYDIIIIDNPPVGLVSDGLNVLAMADIPIYVFKANYSKRHFVKRVDELTKLNKIKNLNVVLNAVTKLGKEYGYGYGYGYSSYYVESDRPKSSWKRLFKRRK